MSLSLSSPSHAGCGSITSHVSLCRRVFHLCPGPRPPVIRPASVPKAKPLESGMRNPFVLGRCLNLPLSAREAIGYDPCVAYASLKALMPLVV